MRKYLIWYAAIILLIVDVPIGMIKYPAYEKFVTEAPKTVNMVINHVVGHKLRIDFSSDLLGYILLAVSSAMLMKRNDRFRKVFLWAAIGLGIYVCWQIMPFYLNGSFRFRVGYMLYFIETAIKMVVVFQAMYQITHKLENTSNHSFNNITVIMLMLCCACGLVARFMWFFDLLFIYVAYIVAQNVFFGVYSYRLWRDRKLILRED